MHYVAFLVLWMQLDAGMPPTAAFVQKFDTYKECEAYRARIAEAETKRRTACLLVVVEPKEGIKE